MNRKIHSILFFAFALAFSVRCFGCTSLPLYSSFPADHSLFASNTVITAHRVPSAIDIHRKSEHNIIHPIRTKALDDSFAVIFQPVISLHLVSECPAEVIYNCYTSYTIFQAYGASLLRGPPRA